jgi:hypothetical protein
MLGATKTFFMMKKRTIKQPGPKPETLAIEGDWKDAIKKSLGKKSPVEGWPKPTPKKKSKV